jgi:hypothetical protein
LGSHFLVEDLPSEALKKSTLTADCPRKPTGCEVKDGKCVGAVTPPRESLHEQSRSTLPLQVTPKIWDVNDENFSQQKFTEKLRFQFPSRAIPATLALINPLSVSARHIFHVLHG